jgi:anti-anti-sigma factor
LGVKLHFFASFLNVIQSYPDITIETYKECPTLKRRAKMGIENWSADIILAHLSQEPKMADELNAVTEIIRQRGDCDVVIDFSSIDFLNTSGIAKLLTLRKLLTECGHRAVLCSVSEAVKGIFMVTGLDRVFDFADDKFAALSGLLQLSHNTG